MESTLRVKILGDSTGLNKSLKGIGAQLNQLGPKMKNIGAQLSTRLTLPIALAGGAAIKMASDLEESFNKVDVAFKDSSGVVREFADTTLESFGIARGTALDMAALFGDMATSMGLSTGEAANMSTSLVGLAGDLASFKNMNIEEVTTALNGVFTGETESLKRLGVVMTQVNLQQFAMSQGIQKNIKDMTQAEKVSLRYNYVLSVTKNAQGDFARTSDGAANQMRIFQESLKQLGAAFGQTILPMFTSVVKKANGVLEVFQNLNPSTRKFSVVVALVVAAIPPLVYAIGSLVTAFGALNLVTGGIIVAVGAVVALLGATVKYNSLKTGIDEVTKSLQDLKVAESEAQKQLDGSADSQTRYLQAQRERIKAELELLKLQQDKEQGAIARLLGIESDEYVRLGNEIKATEEKIKGYDMAISGMTQNTQSQTKAIEDQSTALQKLRDDKLAQLKLEEQMAAEAKQVESEFVVPDEFKEDPSFSAVFDNPLDNLPEPETMDVEFLDEADLKFLDALADKYDTAEESAEKFEERMKKFSETISNKVEGAFRDLGSTMVQQLGLGEGALGAFASTFLMSMIDVVGGALAGALASAIAGAAQGSLLSGPLAPIVLPALLAGAMAAIKSAFSANVPALAQGGIVSAPTLAMVGDNFGASNGNPEVIAPLNKLKGMMGNNNVNVAGEFRLNGQDLVVALQRAERNRKRIL